MEENNEHIQTVYCDNAECRWNKPLDKAVDYNFDKRNFKPFENDVFNGVCSKRFLMICGENFTEGHTLIDSAFCGDMHRTKDVAQDSQSVECDRRDCQYNKSGESCVKDNLFIGKSNLDLQQCRSISFKKIRGHRDWMSLLNVDGTAKGGNVDDAYANKMYKDSLKYKIFPDGSHKDSKEPRRKK